MADTLKQPDGTTVTPTHPSAAVVPGPLLSHVVSPDGTSYHLHAANGGALTLVAD